ncbi:MAG TPA: sec-independent translocase [Streptosporangiaceae bacterium]|nr:sec-independent translocase [Streptosporangiaceae bacterium]
MLDLDLPKLLFLGVVALIVFGPERLPSMAAQAGRALRELRRMAEGAKSELQENLGPEFSQFDLADINPKHFVRKHLLDDLTSESVVIGGNGHNGNNTATLASRAAPVIRLSPGESPPYDSEAT